MFCGALEVAAFGMAAVFGMEGFGMVAAFGVAVVLPSGEVTPGLARHLLQPMEKPRGEATGVSTMLFEVAPTQSASFLLRF